MHGLLQLKKKAQEASICVGRYDGPHKKFEMSILWFQREKRCKGSYKYTTFSVNPSHGIIRMLKKQLMNNEIVHTMPQKIFFLSRYVRPATAIPVMIITVSPITA